MLAATSITFFFVADVKRGLYEIKNNRANATHGMSLVQTMFRDRTEVMLNWRGPGPGPGPGAVLNLVPVKGQWCSEGKVAVSLAMHWRCITDYRLEATEKEMSYILMAAVIVPFTFTSVSYTRHCLTEYY